MAKLLFIVPPYVGWESFINPAFNDGVMIKKSGRYRNIVAEIPMGPVSISAYLKKHAQVDVRLLDFNALLQRAEDFHHASFVDFFRDVLGQAQWHDFSPDIIGISTLFTPSYHATLEVAEVARRLFPAALLVGGGGVATNMYAEIFRDCSAFDALCHGEGERPMRDLLAAADWRHCLETHGSWITRCKANNGTTFEHDLIEDLDDIPFWDFDILDREDYHLNSVLSTFPMAEGKTRSMPVMTSRGCPHKCSFCASHTVHGRAMRYQSLARVAEDFTRLRDEFGATTIVFYDDHLMSSKRRALAVLQILCDLGLKAFFPSSLALYALDREVLEKLKAVGLETLVLSVESGSDRVLRKVMRKPLNLKIVSRVIEDCKDLDLATDVAILIGLPGETKADIDDTLAFLKTLDATWFRINIATPLLGTEMLEICQRNNYLRGDYLNCDYKRAIVETEDFSADYIQEKVYAMNLELNFVGNSDFRTGNYARALLGFENALRVKKDHAFALYFAAQCHERLGNMAKSASCLSEYRSAVATSPYWKQYAERFGLPH